MKLEDIEKYKEELEAGIKKCMSNPVCERSTNAIDSMVLCWQHITDMENMIKKQFELTPEKAEEWLLNMQNEDGTKGPHWSMQETDSFKPEGIDSHCWDVAMNMMYSDYFSVAVSYGANTPDFYAELAKAFLMDKDTKQGKAKLAAYYNCIVDAD